VDSLIHFLKICGYFAILIAVVPLAGLCLTGTWRGAWAMLKMWGSVMGLTIAAAAVVWLIIWPFIPAP
jgi:hypothetical protein